MISVVGGSMVSMRMQLQLGQGGAAAWCRGCGR
jgi:hypothetical protein